MIFRRRAPLLSASDIPRRVCDEVAANSACAVEHRIPRYGAHQLYMYLILKCIRDINSLPRSLNPTSRAMHTTPPRPTLSPSACSTCKWKRGRPVTTRTNIGREVHQASKSRRQSLIVQPTSADTMPLAGGIRRVGLWDPSQALRFAPPVPVESQHLISAPADTQPMCQPELDVPETAHARLPGDDTIHVNSGTGVVEKGQENVENTIGLAEEHAPSSVKAPNAPRTVTDRDGSHVQEDGAHDNGIEVVDENNTLSYQIPEEKLRAAMLAPPKTRASYWSAKLYEGPEGEAIHTHYCRSMEVAERVAQYFLKEKVVGFDIEWKPWGSPTSIKHNASLIQLACEDRIALFHIALFSGTEVEQLMPPSLKAVLESPDICKVGVAIKGDFKRLEKYLGIQAQGVFELSRLHNLVEWYEVDPSKVSKKLVGLAAQVLQHLQLPLYKGEPLENAPETKSSVRESNWSLPLDLQQIHYAAADAYAGFRLYHVLEWKRTRLRPTPPPIALCDYDNNKPTPKPSKLRILRKTVKATTKSKDVGKPDVDPAVDVVEEGEEAEEEVGYETAPDELIDSHELEDPTPVISSRVSADTEDVAVKTRLANNTEPQKEQHSDHHDLEAEMRR
jgi:hypothetical protein